LKKNVWHNLESHPEISFGQYIVPNFVSNSVSIKISDTEYVVISPGEPLLSTFLIDRHSKDTKIHIIMPNAFHFMGVSAWQMRFSNTTLYASKKAKALLIEKGVAKNENDILSLEDKQPPLPENYSILFPPGHRGGDVWLKKQDTHHSSVWITCDSFLNYERLSNQPVARIMQKILNAAPGLKISQVIKWFIFKDKKEFKLWVLDQLELDNPTTLIPSHGEIAKGEDLPNKLQLLVRQRL